MPITDTCGRSPTTAPASPSASPCRPMRCLAVPVDKDTIIVVDDDAEVRDSLEALLEASGFDVRSFAAATALLADDTAAEAGCAVVDIRMPDMDGLALQQEL